ncbi:hypothetical protein [Longimicrobium sp.]|uniref:hypothetical protein n=1 Tax=Longimicrobium sp. TaxID=2029185 RepID=UPI002C58C553|nr:hypothetical protein [Longimicrobium sp.]HSU12564.1 hypothetical protein [Longimicrobium sp.]
MRPMKLDLARLAVESFATAPGSPAAVTAHELAATPLCVNTLPVNECLTQDTFRNC